MTDIKVILESLRYCKNGRDCEECPYQREYGGCDKLGDIAASIIEEQQDKIHKYEAQISEWWGRDIHSLWNLLNKSKKNEEEPIKKPEQPQEQKKGMWVLKRDEKRHLYTICGECGFAVSFTNYRGGLPVDMRGANYCPHCGSPMRK